MFLTVADPESDGRTFFLYAFPEPRHERSLRLGVDANGTLTVDSEVVYIAISGSSHVVTLFYRIAPLLDSYGRATSVTTLSKFSVRVARMEFILLCR